ncbi:hypothetical protein HMPREF1991_01754 [Hoylesella loescheii DSM 19665 = JCM 12249 = ATCC 15930]|uniref:Uncharacterized protein n=1 Tax=Hoylesella loescheii DSM 19665 = JCM 12249 = ATCC 15930 TaxID=1122985 RepID=A0A069QJB4_HOYLO|nr:hypothetical protein HMPREF1991_01754 [Hoylesella loescheii DSM 19665 = JCM 12249 = ATCC 15930]
MGVSHLFTLFPFLSFPLSHIFPVILPLIMQTFALNILCF